MRSRNYISKFYPVGAEKLDADSRSDVFVDLKRANESRVAQQQIKKELKQNGWDANRTLVITTPKNVTNLEIKVARVKIIGIGINFESQNNMQHQNFMPSRKSKAQTTIFHVMYKDGTKKKIEAFNGSQLFRLLLKYCKKN